MYILTATLPPLRSVVPKLNDDLLRVASTSLPDDIHRLNGHSCPYTDQSLESQSVREAGHQTLESQCFYQFCEVHVLRSILIMLVLAWITWSCDSTTTVKKLALYSESNKDSKHPELKYIIFPEPLYGQFQPKLAQSIQGIWEMNTQIFLLQKHWTKHLG